MTEKAFNKITVSSGKRKPRSLKDNPSDYKLVKMANIIFLFCIIFELVGIMTIMFFGTVGAQMSIYFMTFLFSLFLYLKHKKDFSIPISIKQLSLKKVLYLTTLTICGIPVAMVLSAMGNVLSKTTVEDTNDVNTFPVIPALIIYALIPAVVEEFVFRGVILGIYTKVDVKAGILISSLFFALLHFSMGSVLYGFLFGVIFAIVRLDTDNILYTMIMHCVFNGVNVLLSYVNMESVPATVFIVTVIIMFISFVVMLIWLVRKNMQVGVNLPSMTNDGKYAVSRLITKEGYITISICLVVMVMLLII